MIALGLGLTLLMGCGDSGETTAYDPATLGPALVESGAFDQVLGQLDEAMIAPYYGLETAPVEGVLYASLEGGYEELAVLVFADEAEAEAAVTLMVAHVARQMEAESSMQYRPEDLPKLEGAIVRQEGDSVLLVVAADYDGIEDILAE